MLKLADQAVLDRPPIHSGEQRRLAQVGHFVDRLVETLGYARVRAAGATYTTRMPLTRSQRGKLRAGDLRLAVAYGTCRTVVGQWAWLTTNSREGRTR
jgi:hypothetical protein